MTILKTAILFSNLNATHVWKGGLSQNGSLTPQKTLYQRISTKTGLFHSGKKLEVQRNKVACLRVFKLLKNWYYFYQTLFIKH